MPEGRVSFETVRTHHGIWRWKLEREASQRLVTSWRAVQGSGLHPESKVRLMNAAWSLATFERAYNMLASDARRAEQARADGVPAVMALLTGPYERSLDYLLTMSLWLDLGEVLAAYRTVVDRFALLKGPARRGQLPVLLTDVEAELSVLREGRLPSLSEQPVTDLANRILHEAWHPTEDDALALGIYWKQREGTHIVDFGTGDVRGELLTLAERTVKQVNQFIMMATKGDVSTVG